MPYQTTGGGGGIGRVFFRRGKQKCVRVPREKREGAVPFQQPSKEKGGKTLLFRPGPIDSTRKERRGNVCISRIRGRWRLSPVEIRNARGTPRLEGGENPALTTHHNKGGPRSLVKKARKKEGEVVPRRCFPQPERQSSLTYLLAGEDPRWKHKGEPRTYKSRKIRLFRRPPSRER